MQAEVGVKIKGRWFQRMPGTEEGWKYMEITQVITNGADCYPWREVYAWWPVKTVSGEYVWREKVFKRKVWVVWGTGFHMEPEVQYATMFERLQLDADNILKK